MDIQAMLDAEQQIFEYLVDKNMAGTAEDFKTLIHEVRRLREIEDIAMGFFKMTAWERRTVRDIKSNLANNPRPRCQVS